MRHDQVRFSLSSSISEPSFGSSGSGSDATTEITCGGNDIFCCGVTNVIPAVPLEFVRLRCFRLLQRKEKN